MDKYSVSQSVLGEGGFGVVKLVRRKEDGQLFAVKEVSLNAENIKSMDNVRKEERILQQLNHECIVKFVESFETVRDYVKFHCIVMEYCCGGNLDGRIQFKKNSRDRFLERQVLDALLQITLAVDQIHSLDIVHRDIKPQNVFISMNGTLKLGDFGAVKELQAEQVTPGSSTFQWTMAYSAPEIWRSEKFTPAADIWSLGCVLFELMELKSAFDFGNDIVTMKEKIQAADYPEVTHPNVSEHLKAILRRLLDKDPEARPTAKAILEDPEFKAALDNVKKHILSESGFSDDPDAALKFPDPYPEGTLERLKNPLVIQCDEEGRFYHDWRTSSRFDSLTFGNKTTWKERVRSNGSSTLIACTMLLPQQMGNRVFQFSLEREETKLVICGLFNPQFTPRDVNPLSFNCRVRIVIPHASEEEEPTVKEFPGKWKLTRNRARMFEPVTLPFDKFDPEAPPSVEFQLLSYPYVL